MKNIYKIQTIEKYHTIHLLDIFQRIINIQKEKQMYAVYVNQEKNLIILILID